MLHFLRLPKGPLLDAKPTIIAVAEIVLRVRDLPAMRDFYRTVLGFELLSEACHETGPEPDAEGKPRIKTRILLGPLALTLQAALSSGQQQPPNVILLNLKILTSDSTGAAKDLADYQRLTAEGKLAEAGQKLEQLKRKLDELNARQK